MPSVYAHYVFGKKVYKLLPKEEKKMIKQAKDAYLLGLHGPDLLFYYFPICKNRINQQGRKMHGELAADFFDKGRKKYQKDRIPALRAYLYGFLCHFILDSECHPYITCYMEEHELGHLEIETEFDRYLMEKDGFDPLYYVPIHHLIGRKHTRKQISGMFDRVSPGQIAICIYLFRKVITLFICRNPLKRIVMRKISKITGQDRYIGGLIMDGRIRLDCEESDAFLEERLKMAVPVAVKEICQFGKVLDGNSLLSLRLYRDYEKLPFSDRS